MHIEVSVALNFVISFLYNRLPRRKVSIFGEELEKGLKKKFEGHWYPDQPFKGSAFRCIRVNGDKEIDPVVIKVAHDLGLDMEELKEVLPKDLTVWIDPGEVSYRIGEKGFMKVLFSDKSCRGGSHEDLTYESLDKEIQAVSRGFNPEAQSFKPIDSISSSLSSLSLSPSSPTAGLNGWGSVSPSQSGISASTSPTVVSNNHHPAHSTLFTTASFAATKFGSTKLKTHKRSSRLSPTEMGAYIKQRSNVPNVIMPPFGNMKMAPARPRTLDPFGRDMHQEIQEQQQQQRMFLTQCQQPPQQLSPQHIPSPCSPMDDPQLDLYPFHNAPTYGLPNYSFGANVERKQPNSKQGQATSPEENRAFLDTLSPYANLQHMLVAN